MPSSPPSREVSRHAKRSMEQLLGCPTCPSFSQEEEPVVNRMEQKDRGSRACLCDLIQGGVFDWARDRPVIHYGCGLDDWHLRCEDAAASAATSAFQVRILLGRARPAEGGGDGPSDVLDEVDQQSQNHGYPSAEGRESEREREREPSRPREGEGRGAPTHL